jgi:dTMP kinase
VSLFFGRLVGAYLNGDYGSLKDVHPVVASVLYAGDRFEKSGEINQALEENKLVLANRYTPSNKAHQGSKIPREQWPVFCQHIDQMEYGVFKVPKEDWVFLLDVTPEIGQKLVDEKAEREWLAERRIGAIRKRDIAEEDLDHQMKASDVYKWMATFYSNWSVIQCCDLQGQILPKETIGDLVIAETERLNILPR